MEYQELDIEMLTPNPMQPREKFTKENIKELANSIKIHGILQPIVVRKKGNRYEIICGERRWRASKLANKATIPAVIKNVSDNQVLVESLIENLHRQDLSSTEREHAIQEIWVAGIYKNQGDLADALGYSDKTAIQHILKAREIRDEAKTPSSVPTSSLYEVSRIPEKNLRESFLKRVEKGEIQTSEVGDVVTLMKKAPESVQKEFVSKTSTLNPEKLKILSEVEDEKTQIVVLNEVKKYDYSDRELKERVEDIRVSQRKGIETPAIDVPRVHDSNQMFIEEFQKSCERILLVNHKRIVKLIPKQKQQIIKMVDAIEEKCQQIREALEE
ncbi:MAG: ParB/RepB/Spo0J family partition protein [Methanobacteriota archaeon]